MTHFLKKGMNVWALGSSSLSPTTKTWVRSVNGSKIHLYFCENRMGSELAHFNNQRIDQKQPKYNEQVTTKKQVTSTAIAKRQKTTTKG